MNWPESGTIIYQATTDTGATITVRTYSGTPSATLSSKNTQRLSTMPFPHNSRCLSDDQIVEILTSQESNIKLGQLFGVSRQTVCDARRGKSYAHVAPELPRQGSTNVVRCTTCIHYNQVEIPNHAAGQSIHNCGLGFPEIRADGPRCARLCSAYVEVTP